MPGLTIPAKSRVLVRARDEHRCVVCGMRGLEWHHRRTRRVRDDHTHCPCNGITVCGRGNDSGDHGWIHTNPFEAQVHGLIISRYSPRLPFEVPMLTHQGWVLLGCEGQVTLIAEPTV